MSDRYSQQSTFLIDDASIVFGATDSTRYCYARPFHSCDVLEIVFRIPADVPDNDCRITIQREADWGSTGGRQAIGVLAPNTAWKKEDTIILDLRDNDLAQLDPGDSMWVEVTTPMTGSYTTGANVFFNYVPYNGQTPVWNAEGGVQTKRHRQAGRETTDGVIRDGGPYYTVAT